jgi:hypothetical protein
MGFHVGKHSGPCAAIAKTLRAVFKSVRCIRDEDPSLDHNMPYNIMCFASHRTTTISFTLPPIGTASAEEVDSIPWLYTKLDEWIVLHADESGMDDVKVLTSADHSMLTKKPLPPVHQLLRVQIQGYVPDWVWQRTSSTPTS